VKPPKGLGKAGSELWVSLWETFDMSEDPHRINLLEELCLTKDLCVRLQADIDAAAGLEVRGSQGQPVVMGQVGELRQMRSLMATLTKSLGLPDTEELSEVKRTHLSLVRSAAAKSRKRKVAY
jgi:hypothetical protein